MKEDKNKYMLEPTEPQAEQSEEELVVSIEQRLSGLEHWVDLVAERDQDPSSRSGNASRLKIEIEQIKTNFSKLKGVLKTS